MNIATKLDQEAEIAPSGVPWTIVRATQFHTLLARTFAASVTSRGAWRGTVTFDAWLAS